MFLGQNALWNTGMIFLVLSIYLLFIKLRQQWFPLYYDVRKLITYFTLWITRQSTEAEANLNSMYSKYSHSTGILTGASEEIQIHTKRENGIRVPLMWLSLNSLETVLDAAYDSQTFQNCVALQTMNFPISTDSLLGGFKKMLHVMRIYFTAIFEDWYHKAD